MPSLRSWLGLERREPQEVAPLRDTLDALDHMEPERAKFLAAFAYILGRVAHADRDVSAEEVAAMEAAVRAEGGLSQDQAMVVVQLARTNNLLFGGTADFLVAREFGALATYEQKLALMRCLFAVAASDTRISVAEEGEIHRIANELRVQRGDLVALRISHGRHLPGLAR
ncbi:MAG: TerB family tellurite resistance protein [Vicinamibacterales bacterium]